MLGRVLHGVTFALAIVVSVVCYQHFTHSQPAKAVAKQGASQEQAPTRYSNVTIERAEAARVSWPIDPYLVEGAGPALQQGQQFPKVDAEGWTAEPFTEASQANQVLVVDVWDYG